MEQTKKSDFLLVHLLLAALSVLGATGMVVSTKWGIGLSPDSAVYMAAAQNLLRGEGLSAFSYPGELALVTHYPPLYSTLLAAMGIFGIDPIHSSRWLNALFFAANIAMVGLILYTSTRSLWALVFGGFLMVDSLPMIQIHSMAWSEPVFIFFVLLSIFLFVLYIDKPTRWLLAAASLAVALGFLTRYAGIALVGTGVIFMLVRGGGVEWKQKLKDIAMFSTLSCVPIAIWIIRNLVGAGSVINRRLTFHLPSTGQFQAVLDTFSNWFIPAGIAPTPRWVRWLLLASLFILALTALRRGVGQARKGCSVGFPKLPLLMVCFIASYGLLLFLFVSFLDAHTPINNRILSPLYVSILMLAVSLVAHFLPNLASRSLLRPAVIAIGLLFSALQLAEVAEWFKFSYREGIGYAERSWRESSLIKHIQGLDSSIPIFSNAPDAIYLLSGHPAVMIPRKVNTDTQQINEDYFYELEDMRKRLKEHDGVLVYFNRIAWRWYLPSEQELKEALGLGLLLRAKDGSIYG